MTTLKTPPKVLWTCPKCKRKFERKDQPHSCKYYPIEQHFEHRSKERKLYEQLKKAIKINIDHVKVESLECCIHFVSNFTFAAVKIMKGKIRLDFALNHLLKNNRIIKSLKMSTNRWLYVVDLTEENDINDELLQWLKEANERSQ